MTHRTAPVETTNCTAHRQSLAVLGPPKEVDHAYLNEATSHWLKELEGVT